MPRIPVKILVACRPESFDELSSSLNSISNCTVAGRSHNEVDMVRLAGSLKPDLVVIQHEPPHLDGREISLRLRDEPQEAKLLILLNEPNRFFSLIETRANGYEVFPGGSLARCVDSLVDSGFWIGPEIAKHLLTGAGFEILRKASECSLDHAKTLSSLSTRELEVLDLLRGGLTNQEIADRMRVRVGTVKVHVKHILAKLNMDNRGQAIARFAAGSLVPDLAQFGADSPALHQ